MNTSWDSWRSAEAQHIVGQQEVSGGSTHRGTAGGHRGLNVLWDSRRSLVALDIVVEQEVSGAGLVIVRRHAVYVTLTVVRVH